MCWFAAYTKSRSEFKALDYFNRIKVNSYVPEYTDVRQWSDRQKKIRTPAISGYIFFELEKIYYDILNSNPYTRNIVKSLGHPVKIKKEEISLLKETLNQSLFGSELKNGDVVKIKSGVFKNNFGKINAINKNHITLVLNKIKVRLSHASSKIALVN